MSAIISILFILLAIIIFVTLIGLPIWVAIYLIKQYKKNKKLSVFQIVLVIIIGIVIINFFGGLSTTVLNKISQNYGVKEMQTTLTTSSERR